MQTFSTISSLKEAYAKGTIKVNEYIKACLDNAKSDTHNAWISFISDQMLEKYLENLKKLDMSLPLWGVPFAIKDNIDLEGINTTAACKEYSYLPKKSAFAVKKLIENGAIPLGKTNMDQFATGLVGVRSPYGPCQNSINREYVSGGSSSGSAVSVALGQVLFSLGTDTAGSGRVPAAFNNILGLKGTCGRVSCTGVVPACKSIDCLTVFANTVDDLSSVFNIIKAYDREDCYAREVAINYGFDKCFKFGVPQKQDLEFFNDEEAKKLFYLAIENLKKIGGTPVEINLRPFLDAAKLLYEGSFVTERLSGNKEFFDEHLDVCLDVIQKIIGGSRKFTAADAYSNNYKLMEYKRICYEQMEKVDFVITPTTGTTYKINEVLDNPIVLNSNLGYYTNFMNLLDFCAIALPAGFREQGPLKDLPFGITLFSKAFSDEALLSVAALYTNYCKYPLGANKAKYQDSKVTTLKTKTMNIVVCGAHMQGLALNYQLKECGAQFIKRTYTAAGYKMYKIFDDGKIIKPGLIKDDTSMQKFEVEVYKMPIENIGYFLSNIPYPLGLGSIELEDGSIEIGFTCEGQAVKGCMDISSFGSFKKYIENKQ